MSDASMPSFSLASCDGAGRGHFQQGPKTHAAQRAIRGAAVAHFSYPDAHIGSEIADSDKAAAAFCARVAHIGI